jgi:serine/threonine protein kinase
MSISMSRMGFSTFKLLCRIVEKEYYSEGEARKVARVLVDALAYIHSKGVVHR